MALPSGKSVKQLTDRFRQYSDWNKELPVFTPLTTVPSGKCLVWVESGH